MQKYKRWCVEVLLLCHACTDKSFGDRREFGREQFGSQGLVASARNRSICRSVVNVRGFIV